MRQKVGLILISAYGVLGSLEMKTALMSANVLNNSTNDIIKIVCI